MSEEATRGSLRLDRKRIRTMPGRPSGRSALGGLGMAGTLGLLGVLLGACGNSASSSIGAEAAQVSALCASSAPKLTLQGNGIATGTPDLLTLVAEVDVTKPTAAEALSDDNDKAAALISALKQGGVAARDIQTTNLTIQPSYQYPHGVATLVGYSVSNTLVAKIHDLADAGTLIDSVEASGGSDVHIDSLLFSVEDPRSLEDQARADAVKQAVGHAEAMALAAGDRLGPVCSLTDDASAPGPVRAPSTYFNAVGVAAPASAQAVPLSAGTEQETASVTIVYALEAPRGRV